MVFLNIYKVFDCAFATTLRGGQMWPEEDAYCTVQQLSLAALRAPFIFDLYLAKRAAARSPSFAASLVMINKE